MMRKVLIVDDDSRFRILLRRLLEKKFRMQVFEAGNGIEGIELYLREAPQLIILDISMPYMNGAEYLVKIRQEHEDLTTAVIVLTNFSNKDAIEKIIKLGITDYVVKADYVLGLAERINDILIKEKIF